MALFLANTEGQQLTSILDRSPWTCFLPRLNKLSDTVEQRVLNPLIMFYPISSHTREV